MSDKTPHIVIVGPAHPLRGGLATYNERLAQEFQKNTKVTLLTFSLQYPSLLFPGESQYTDDPKPQNLPIDIAINSINPFNWIRVGLKYRKLQPDLIIFRYWMPFFGPCFGVIGRIIKGNNYTKLVAITDNIIPHERRFFDRPFTQFFLNKLDGAVAMSRKVLDDLRQYYPGTPVAKNCQYHPHPLYDNFGDRVTKADACTRLNLDPNRRYILFFGFIRQYKGLDWLLEAFIQFADSNEDIDLIVAGEFYEDSKPYLDIVNASNQQSRIHLHTHFIPNSGVADYFSVCDLVAQPYKNATQSGVSQVAYHFEVPMLITDVGGLSELLPHGEAAWVCKSNVSGITEGLNAVFQGDNIAYIKSRLPELKKQFSWTSMTQILTEVGNYQ